MPFEQAIKNIFEKGTEDFNSQELENFINTLHPDMEYYCPEIKTINFYTPETKLVSRDEVLAYWADLQSKYDNVIITEFDYIKIGKLSKVRCVYGKVGFTCDVELHFDEYAKAYKMINSLVSADKD